MNHQKSILLLLFLISSSFAQANDKPIQENAEEAGVSSVPDLYFSLGFSHTSRAGFGVQVSTTSGRGAINNDTAFDVFVIDTRVFMSAFTDLPVLRDFGLSFHTAIDLNLQYVPEGTDFSVPADHSEYRLGLWYKLGFDDFMFKPAVLAVAGYGQLSHILEGPIFGGRNSVYKYPYFGLEARFMPIEPWLRIFGRIDFFFFSASGLLHKDEEIREGMHAQAGVDGCFWGYYYLGVVYDYNKFYNLPLSFDLSEEYQSVIFRFGLSYR